MNGTDTTGKRTAGFKAGQSAAGGIGYEREVSQCLAAKMSATEPTMVSYGMKIGESLRRHMHKAARELSCTLTRSDGKRGDNQPTVVAFAQNTREEVRKVNGNGAVCGALAANGGMHQTNYLMKLAAGFKGNNGPKARSVGYGRETGCTLNCKPPGCEPTMMGVKRAGGDFKGQHEKTENEMTAEVRRLTPVETSRLMGMPDEHLAIHGEETSDSSWFSCNGNGWARNCSRWVFKNIHKVDEAVTGVKRAFKIGSVSSGQGTHEMSVMDFGDVSVFCSEIAPFPCEVLKTRFPEMPNLGDVTRVQYDAEKGVLHNRKRPGYSLMSEEQLGFKPVDAEEIEITAKYGEIDCISGGLPCFTKGAFVLTATGYKPIEQIKVGDVVVTHLGNFRKVVRVNRRRADNVVEVKALSRPSFKVTASHPFWTATARRDFRRKATTFLKTLIENPRFEEIGAIGKGGVISRLNHDRMKVDGICAPALPTVYSATRDQIMELCGWYVGDGYIARKKCRQKKEVILCLNDKNLEKFKARFSGSVHFCTWKDRTAHKVHVCCTALADFCIAHFGELSYAKTIPAWLICGDEQDKKAFVEGYLSTDGCVSVDNGSIKKRFSTTSPSLAYGLADLLGRACVFENSRYGECVIEGRVVKQRPSWEIDSYDGTKTQHEYGIWDFMRISGIKPCDPEMVFNIEVDGDNSYVCNGFCVHNCTDVSVAGKRKGAEEGSGTRSALAYELPRIGKETGARWLVYENVAGLLSSNGGVDFAWFIHRLAEAGYCVAWRMLDAQYVRCDMHPRAVPQRRRRVWVVAYRGDDWRVPCKALFEPMKVLGLKPPKRTVGVGYLSRVVGEAAAPQKSELMEFVDFVEGADKGVLELLVNTGICESPEDRKRELEAEEKAAGGDEGDLFGDLFGQPEEIHQGRGISECDVAVAMPEQADVRKIPHVSVYEWAKGVCDEVCYVGQMFKAHEGAANVGDLDERMLANVGNAGFMCGGVVCTMKMPEWNAGVTREELAGMPKELAELYDGDVCGLSDVLVEDADPKYKLSWRACYGILKRAKCRGKKLPIELGYALVSRIVEQCAYVKWVAENGKETDKKEGDLSERAIAKLTYDTFVEPFAPWADVVAVEPKKGEAAEEMEEDECGEGDDGEAEEE